jgi:pyridoxamine 5'-phosphate oxidase
MQDLSNIKSYDKSELLESAIPEDPINLLTHGFMK